MRLHSLRDYYSMAALVAQYPGIHLTINLTPILLWQIEDYAARGATDTLSAELFGRELPPGWTLATMNFHIRPDAEQAGRAGRTFVSTETRVYAHSDARRRQFAVYWRVIYPGSALIRRGWLRAIERRAAA